MPVVEAKYRPFYAVFALCVLVLVVVYTFFINRLSIPYVQNDSYAYWTIAAMWAGFDWSSFAYRFLGGYYSFGYSIVLYPLILLGFDAVTTFRLALMVNAALSVAVFPIAYKTARNLFPQVNMWALVGLSFCVALYPANIVQSYETWTETLLYFLVWVLVYLACKVHEKREEKTCLYYIVAFSVLLGYCFMVHNRTLGILASGSLFICLVAWKMKKIKYAVVSTGIVLTMVAITQLAAGSIKRDILTHRNVSTTNTFSGLIERVCNLFTVDGIWSFINVLAGHLFYFGAATLLLGYIGVFLFSSNIVRYAVSVFKKKAPPFRNEEEGRKINVHIFLMISFIFSLFISVYALKSPVMGSHVIYGRYIEILFPPVMMFSLLEMIVLKIDIKRKLWLLVFPVVLFASFGLLVNSFIVRSSLRGINVINVVVVSPFVTSGELDFSMSIIWVTAIHGFIHLSVLINQKNRLCPKNIALRIVRAAGCRPNICRRQDAAPTNNKSRTRPKNLPCKTSLGVECTNERNKQIDGKSMGNMFGILSILCVCALFVMCGYYTILNAIFPFSERNRPLFTEIYQTIRSHSEGRRMYFLTGGYNWGGSAQLQFMLFETTLQFIEHHKYYFPHELNDFPAIMVSSRRNIDTLKFGNPLFTCNSTNISVWSLQDDSVIEELTYPAEIEIPISFMRSAWSGNSIQSDGTAGHFFIRDIQLGMGKYKFEIHYEVLNRENNASGLVRVHNRRHDLTLSGDGWIVGGDGGFPVEGALTLPFETNGIMDVDFLIYNTEGMSMRINKLILHILERGGDENFEVDYPNPMLQ